MRLGFTVTFQTLETLVLTLEVVETVCSVLVILWHRIGVCKTRLPMRTLRRGLGRSYPHEPGGSVVITLVNHMGIKNLIIRSQAASFTEKKIGIYIN